VLPPPPEPPEPPLLFPFPGGLNATGPNPKASKSNPYVPLNRPAIGDMMDLFSFSKEKK